MKNRMLCASDTRAKSISLYLVLAHLGMLIFTLQPLRYAVSIERPYEFDYISPGQCGPYDGMLLCGRKIENQALISSQLAILRADEVLCLPLLEREVLEREARCFNNKKNPGDAYLNISYAFVGSFINSYYLVMEILDEDWNLLMISIRDGDEVRLLSYPVLNPSNTAFAIASFDTDAGYSPNLVQIWGIPVQQKPAIEIINFPDNQGPAGITWLSDTKLHITLADIDGASGDQMILQAISSAWSISTVEKTEK